MFFYVQGPNKHDLMPLERIFDRREVKKTSAITKTASAKMEDIYTASEKFEKSYNASHAYETVEQLSVSSPVLFAYQVMTSPVIVLTQSMSIAHALKLFRQKRFRHLPVTSSDQKVIGIVSDRDVMQYLADKQQGQISHSSEDSIENLMQSPVLTSSEQTDVRYIARLFVERRVGAMPVVDNGELKGIITRSDILSAVMNHYELELWI